MAAIATIRLQAQQREISQAVARPVRERYIADTTGAGEASLTDVLFSTQFSTEPAVTFGVLVREALTAGQFPQATAFVTRWRKTSSGMWIGCDLGFKITSTKGTILLRFDIVFEGVGLRVQKGLPTTVATTPLPGA